MVQLTRRASILLVAMLCAASPALAQNPRARGPFAGLFGGGPGTQNAQTLDFRASLFSVWQDVLIPPDFDRALLDPLFDKSGTFGGATGFLNYTFDRSSQSSAVFVNGRAWTSDYSLAPDRPQYGVEAATGLSKSVNLTRRMVWASNVFATYSPFFNFGPVAQALTTGQPGVLPASVTPGLGVAGVGAENVTVSGTTGVREALSRHSTISGNLQVNQVYFLDESSSDSTQLGGNLVYSQQVFRKLHFHVGYQVWQSHVSNPPAWTGPSQNLDLGLDYGDAATFQLTRRTTLSLGGGLGSVRTIPGGTQFRALGNADLTHTFGRTWMGRVGASRTLGFVAAFQEPVLLDSATANLGGQLVNRVSWISVANWSRGYIGLDTSKHFDAVYGASILSYAINRWLQAFAQYGYYRTRLPAGSTALSVLTNFDRQTVSAGLSLYAPIYSRRTTR